MKYILFIAVCLISLANIGFAQKKQISDFAILDANKDGLINPYEAFDMLLTIQKGKKSVRLNKFSSQMKKMQEEEAEEMQEMFSELDKNKNGQVEFDEAEKEEEVFEFVVLMDKDNSKSVSKDEMMSFNFEEAFLLSDKDVKREIKSLFREYTKTDFIVLSQLHDSVRRHIEEWDKNADGQVSKEEAYYFMKANNTPVSFKVEGDVAYMTGVITSSTPAKVLELIFEHSEVKTIEMLLVPGSIDDVANLRASLYVNKFNLNTRLNANSSVASGGTDFFLAGKKRTVAEGAKIGVHSWAGGLKPATELSKSHKAHKKYLNYYEIVNIPSSFYWYTLEAAPAESIHYMTEEEVKLYNIRTNK